MSRRHPHSSSNPQQEEQERQMAQHFVEFLEDHMDEHVFGSDPHHQDELLDKHERHEDYRYEREALERATSVMNMNSSMNDDENTVIYGVETNQYGIRGDHWLLSGLGTFAGLRVSRRLWSNYRGVKPTPISGPRPRLYSLALDGMVSVIVGAYMAFDILQEDELVLRRSIADVPLVPGRSIVSDELCGPLLQEYQSYQRQHPHSKHDQPHQLPELQTLRRFLENCQRRHDVEAKLRQEQGLPPTAPVSIPLPGVVVENDSAVSSPASAPVPSSVSNDEVSQHPRTTPDTTTTTVDKLPQRDDENKALWWYPSSFFDWYWWAFGQAFETIEDFELYWRLKRIRGNDKLHDDEVVARLKHHYHVTGRKALRPDRLYPLESIALYGPSRNWHMLGESFLAGLVYYLVWCHGPRVVSFVRSVLTKRYRAAALYTDSVDYRRFGRVHGVGVAWLWYMVPLMELEAKHLPTVPLVQGRSHVSDEMCSDMIRMFQELNAKETCERTDKEDLTRIYMFVRNCQRRRAYEAKLRREQGLKEDAPVAIPHPGVPVDYSLTSEDSDESNGTTGEDWAREMVADREQETPTNKDSRRK